MTGLDAQLDAKLGRMSLGAANAAATAAAADDNLKARETSPHAFDNKVGNFKGPFRKELMGDSILHKSFHCNEVRAQFLIFFYLF